MEVLFYYLLQGFRSDHRATLNKTQPTVTHILIHQKDHSALRESSDGCGVESWSFQVGHDSWLCTFCKGIVVISHFMDISGLLQVYRPIGSTSLKDY